MTKNSFINVIIEFAFIGCFTWITYWFHENYVVNELAEADYDWDIYFLLDKYHLPLFWAMMFASFYLRGTLLKMKNDLLSIGLLFSAIASCYYTVCFINFQYTLEETALGYVDVVSDLGTNLGSYFYDDELPTRFIVWIIVGYAILLVLPSIQYIKKATLKE